MIVEYFLCCSTLFPGKQKFKKRLEGYENHGAQQTAEVLNDLIEINNDRLNRLIDVHNVH